MKLNELCEACHVLDGATENAGKFVCYRCDRKIRKQDKRRRQESVRDQIRIRQEETTSIS